MGVVTTENIPGLARKAAYRLRFSDPSIGFEDLVQDAALDMFRNYLGAPDNVAVKHVRVHLCRKFTAQKRFAHGQTAHPQSQVTPNDGEDKIRNADALFGHEKDSRSDTWEVAADFAHQLKTVELTPMEWDVLNFLLHQKTTVQIAQYTGLAASSVNTYRCLIFSKLAFEMGLRMDHPRAKKIRYKGKTLTILQVAREMGVSEQTMCRNVAVMGVRKALQHQTRKYPKRGKPPENLEERLTTLVLSLW